MDTNFRWECCYCDEKLSDEWFEKIRGADYDLKCEKCTIRDIGITPSGLEKLEVVETATRKGKYKLTADQQIRIAALNAVVCTTGDYWKDVQSCEAYIREGKTE